MTTKQKLHAWAFIVLSYLFSFGTALISGYYYLAGKTIKESKGGAFFYFFIGLVLITMFVSVARLVNKMKANEFKSIFKKVIQIGVVLFLQILVGYITHNFELLTKVLSFTLLGMVIGAVFEVIAVHKYKEYIQEVGIL